MDVFFEEANKKWVAIVKFPQNKGVNKDLGRIISKMASNGLMMAHTWPDSSAVAATRGGCVRHCNENEDGRWKPYDRRAERRWGPWREQLEGCRLISTIAKYEPCISPDQLRQVPNQSSTNWEKSSISCAIIPVFCIWRIKYKQKIQTKLYFICIFDFFSGRIIVFFCILFVKYRTLHNSNESLYSTKSKGGGLPYGLKAKFVMLRWLPQSQPMSSHLLTFPSLETKWTLVADN